MQMKSAFSFLLIGMVLLSGCTGGTTMPVNQIVPGQKDITGKSIEALIFGQEYFPKEQFHVSNSPDDNCKFPHYHAEGGAAISICGENKYDPNPESCGFGKVSEVPAKTIAESQIEKLCTDKDSETPLVCGGISANGKPELSPEDLKKYDKSDKGIKPLAQLQDTTCAPTAGAIDLIYWNNTIVPGLVTSDPEKLMLDLAKRMKTSGVHGTDSDKMALGLADYLAEHAKGRFEVKLVYKSNKPAKTYKSGPKGNQITFERTDSITEGVMETEMNKKANIIVAYVRQQDGKGHAMKMMALSTSGKNGKYKVAFADPASGKIAETEMDYDGNLDANGEKWELASIVSVAPR